jgi:hypothetical protein
MREGFRYEPILHQESNAEQVMRFNRPRIELQSAPRGLFRLNGAVQSNQDRSFVAI